MRVQHFLLLDQDDERRAGLSALLRANGHVGIAERDAAQAVETLIAGPEAEGAVPAFDLLVLDLSIPSLDLARLRDALAEGAASLPDSLNAAERRHIVRALAYTDGNRRRAAQILGISRSTLLAKIRRYGLENAGRRQP